MKIHSELERVLLGEATQKNATTKGSESNVVNTFESLLDNELSALSSAENLGTGSLNYLQALADPLSLSADGLTAMQDKSTLNGSDAEENIVEQIVTGIDTTLSEMESYFQSLQGSSNLKQAWTNLENVSKQTGQMQDAYAQLTQKNASLASMLNNLEAMAVTETYKFNRGDYIQ